MLLSPYSCRGVGGRGEGTEGGGGQARFSSSGSEWEGGGELTSCDGQALLDEVVHGEVDGPRGQVADDGRAESSIKASEAVV